MKDPKNYFFTFLNSKNEENSFLISRKISKISKDSVPLSQLFFPNHGFKVKTTMVYGSVLQVSFSRIFHSFGIAFILNKKMFPNLKHSRLKESLELWKSNKKGCLQKITTIFLNNYKEYWNLKFLHNKVENNINMTIMFSSGWDILIFKLPQKLPPFLKILQPSMRLKLPETFHWVLYCKKNEIISGDIQGKINLIYLNDTIKFKQFHHSLKTSSPVSCIEILSSSLETGKRYLISGGYDGMLKIWNIGKDIALIFQTEITKKWIFSLSFKKLSGRICISITIDDGNIIFFELLNSHKSNNLNLHKFASRVNSLPNNYFLTLGEDGIVLLIRFCFPKSFFHNGFDCSIILLTELISHLKKRKNCNFHQFSTCRYSLKQLDYVLKEKGLKFMLFSGLSGTLILTELD